MTTSSSIPTATYRLQLRKELPFRAVSGLLPYLRQLGVSDLYLSPLNCARAGSIHGYDIVDHRRINPELGDESSLRQLLDDAGAHHLGVILDIVPNHMCIAGDANPLWMDVLEEGRDAESAAHFDIDWDPPKPELMAKVLLPFLGEQYGRVLEEGLSVSFDDGRFFVSWDGQRLPLNPDSWRHVLEPALEGLRGKAAPEDNAVIELESILRALTQTLPALRAAGRDQAVAYSHEKTAIRRRLSELAVAGGPVVAAIAEALRLMNGVRGEPASFDRLERLMDDQHYRLANWRVAAHEVNYRRFFDVNELAAIRVEDPRVFEDVHAIPFSIANHPALTGFRIDHVDGLSDPERYLEDLCSGWREARAGGAADAAADREREDDQAGPFVVVEKILGPAETLPSGWLAQGTTGYDLIPILADLFTRAEGATRLRAVASPFVGVSAPFSDTMYDSKRLALQTTLAAELTVLARRLDRVSEQHRYTRDFTLNHLQAALGEVIACFPVYRTYLHHDDSIANERDAAVVRTAVAAARRRNPLLNGSLFDFIEAVLLRRDPPGLNEAQVEERRTLMTRFQQLTGPVMAKGVEDTAFYRYLPLVALNEVGADPTRMGAPLADIHRALRARAESAPHTLSATATHDTKRGEDTRARLYVLSEVADTWAAATVQWSALNAAHKAKVDGADAPAGAEEYLLYQTLAGTWPLGGWGSEAEFPDRIRAYMAKARHEAKTNTSWINPNPAYDAAAEQFVDAALDPARSGAFLKSVEDFTATIAAPGLWNGLSQVVTKIAAPGIPDFFQGTELWDFSLVDPDNRRLVDFDRRREWLNAMFADFETRGAQAVAGWFDAPNDGRVKLWVTAAALRLRRARRTLFERGGYQTIAAAGVAAEHVFSFARTDGDASVIGVVGRFFATAPLAGARPIGAAWGDTTLALPPGPRDRRWRDVLTGETLTANGDALPLSSVLAHLPVALLETLS